MLLIFLLMLTFSNAEPQTFCTSSVCFTLHLDVASFETAQQNCENNGGNLMTIRSGEEEDALRTLLSQTSLQEKPFKIRIGLKLHRGSCAIFHAELKGFEWVSGGKDSQFSNWGREPQYTCHERCVSVNYNPMGQNHLKWVDGSCNKHFPYVCKFHFKGMCKALAISRHGRITYTLPFSNESKNYQMQLLPVGTLADITCDDSERSDSVWCDKTHGDVYAWSKPGPFCPANRSCADKHGGCEHVCNHEGKEVICSCNGGYELGEDGLSCGLKNMCFEDTCQHQCIMGDMGFTCLCPQGLELASDRSTCSDVDECASQEVCGEHLCVNTEGSYTCNCKDGFEMIDGECSDVDECAKALCEHTCLNSVGSFSCYCQDGFEVSEDGLSCDDIDECSAGPCKFECVNTRGSFLCACPSGYQLDRHGECFPIEVSSESLPESASESSTVLDDQQNFTESLSSTVELQHESPDTSAPPPDFNDTRVRNEVDTSSLAKSPSKSSSDRVLVCVLGSVIPLVVLVAITVAILIVRFNQVKKEAKKNTTTDGYCWVSSGVDARLEKLYESIPTDDL
ncbi:thrombomodulin [Eucyclogobius newberryi]|uniref:thrombomodulin n=1 Tax=Eucyclogobius newberryi TaxID=166745 RepID=UPI003B5AC701